MFQGSLILWFLKALQGIYLVESLGSSGALSAPDVVMTEPMPGQHLEGLSESPSTHPGCLIKSRVLRPLCADACLGTVLFHTTDLLRLCRYSQHHGFCFQREIPVSLVPPSASFPNAL